MDSPHPASPIFLLCLVAGLTAPGWLIGRALRTPGGPIGAFLGSAVVLMNLLLGLDLGALPLDVAHVALGLAVICGGLVLAAKFQKIPAPSPPAIGPSGPAFHLKHHPWLLVPTALGLAAITLRASLEPLSGFDTIFRWDFLARQMLQHGTLGFYPPVSAGDFQLYSWCDGIAPLVSSLYFWAYACAGRSVAWITTPIVVAQAALLFGAVYQLASRRAGAAAGWGATALLATSALLLWGVAMGQETGLTALALVAMFLFIDRQRDEPDRLWLVWAGLAAGAGALAREYGLAFIVIGGGALLWQKVSRRGWLQFLGAAALVALPWFFRNWVKTGNPLYNHSLAGLFAVNPVAAEYLEVVGRLRGLGTAGARGSDLTLLLGRLSGGLIAFGVAGFAWGRTRRGPWLAAVGGVVGLWLWSVGQTSGGAVYSLRVLTPALALAAVAGGVGLGPWLASRRGWIALSLLTLLAVDAGARSLYLPIDPYVSWWRLRASSWLDFRQMASAFNRDPNWAVVATTAGRNTILVTDPYHHALLTKQGAQAIPIFSPAVRFLYEPKTDFRAGLTQLRAGGVRFILLPRGNTFHDAQADLHPFFRTLQATPPTAEALIGRLYDLYSPALLPP